MHLSYDWTCDNVWCRYAGLGKTSNLWHSQIHSGVIPWNIVLSTLMLTMRHTQLCHNQQVPDITLHQDKCHACMIEVPPSTHHYWHGWLAFISTFNSNAHYTDAARERMPSNSTMCNAIMCFQDMPCWWPTCSCSWCLIFSRHGRLCAYPCHCYHKAKTHSSRLMCSPMSLSSSHSRKASSRLDPNLSTMCWAAFCLPLVDG